MFRFASLRALGATLAATIGVALASPAAATVYTFDFTNMGTGAGPYGIATAMGDDGSTLSVKISAWHAIDTTTALSTDKVASATLGAWQGYGLGALYGNDSTQSGHHQIDNTNNGADFLLFQFSSDVSVSALTRNVYSMSGVRCCDSDASYWADTNNVYGAPSSSASITPTTVNESLFTALAGGSSSSTVALAGSASVWMIGAAFNQNNDGFKIAGLTVDTPAVAAVPEPASWAMMIGGFGAVGAGMRRRRTLATA